MQQVYMLAGELEETTPFLKSKGGSDDYQGSL